MDTAPSLHAHAGSHGAAPGGAPSPESLYLDLLKRTLTRSLWPRELVEAELPPSTLKRAPFQVVTGFLRRRGLHLSRWHEADLAKRAEGSDWPASAETMVGLARLSNLDACIRDVVDQGVPGDLLEAGVWRGGASIFMRGALAAYGDQNRTVWVADSFEGLPPPNPERYPADAGDEHHTAPQLAVSMEQVRENFARYGLLDARVRFLKGWFQDTLADAPIDALSVLRLDGDMYESTIVALDALYPKVSVGGYVIIDDYGAVPGCRRAVEDYRRDHGIADPIEEIDWTGVFWRRSG